MIKTKNGEYKNRNFKVSYYEYYEYYEYKGAWEPYP
jgi:hypothetical protein